VQTTDAHTQALAQDLTAFIIAIQKGTGQDWLRLVGELELSISQLKGLVFLEQEGEQSLGDLAERVVLSLPAASRAVEGLHKRGLVGRREDAADRRQKRIAITPEGSAVLARLNEVRLAGAENFVKSMSREEQDALASALKPLLEQITR
jgi:DNA-binding MarR family transcriptional regulator